METIFDIKLTLRIAKDESHKDKFTKEFIAQELKDGNAVIDRGSSSSFVLWLKNNRQVMAVVNEVLIHNE